MLWAPILNLTSVAEDVFWGFKEMLSPPLPKKKIILITFSLMLGFCLKVLMPTISTESGLAELQMIRWWNWFLSDLFFFFCSVIFMHRHRMQANCKKLSYSNQMCKLLCRQYSYRLDSSHPEQCNTHHTHTVKLSGLSRFTCNVCMQFALNSQEYVLN